MFDVVLNVITLPIFRQPGSTLYIRRNETFIVLFVVHKSLVFYVHKGNLIKWGGYKHERTKVLELFKRKAQSNV